MTKLENNCTWAVVANCEAKNDGVIEKFQKIIAVFNYPSAAHDFIDLCLPVENKEKFEVVNIEKL